jgi:hypothetical protein
MDVEKGDVEWLLWALDGLPLALEIANRMAQWVGGFGDLMGEMREGLLESLEIGRKRKEHNVRFAFGLSYRLLDERERTVFCCLSLFAPPFELAPLAYVLGWDTAQASRGLRALVQLGLVASRGAGRYEMHSLLHAYAAKLCDERDETLLPEWKARFAVYYQDETNWREWTQAEGWQWRGSAAERRANVERGCAYAHELERGDLVLAYLLCVGGSYAFANDLILRERWWEWVGELVAGGRERARGALEMAEFYLLSGESEGRTLPEPEVALSLARQVRQVLKGDTDGRDWVRGALVEIESLLLLSRVEEASAQLDDEAFWSRVAGLPEGDPLLYAVWKLCQAVEQQLEGAQVPEYVVRAPEVWARWRIRVTEEHAAQVQSLESMIAEGARVLETADPSEALSFFEAGITEAETNGDGQGRVINALYRSLVLAEMGEEKAAEEARREVGLSCAASALVPGGEVYNLRA